MTATHVEHPLALVTGHLDLAFIVVFSLPLLRLRERGAAVLMASHDLYRAKAIGDRVAILSAGRLMTLVQTAQVEYQDLESLSLRMAAGARASNPQGLRDPRG